MEMVEKPALNVNYELVDIRISKDNGYFAKSVNDFGDVSRLYVIMNEDGYYKQDNLLNHWIVNLGLKICLL